jgi:hypothetical protein
MTFRSRLSSAAGSTLPVGSEERPTTASRRSRVNAVSSHRWAFPVALRVAFDEAVSGQVFARSAGRDRRISDGRSEVEGARLRVGCVEGEKDRQPERRDRVECDFR